MNNKLALTLAIGVIAGVAGYHVYTLQGLAPGIAVLLVVGWLLFNFRNEGAFLNSLGTVFNPLHASLTAFVIGFSYYALKGATVKGALIWSFGLFFFAAIFSMMVFKYWNI